MSATKYVTIWCDSCATWVEPWRATEVTSEARKSVGRLGWTYVSGLDLCPDCAAKRGISLRKRRNSGEEATIKICDVPVNSGNVRATGNASGNGADDRE